MHHVPFEQALAGLAHMFAKLLCKIERDTGKKFQFEFGSIDPEIIASPQGFLPICMMEAGALWARCGGTEAALPGLVATPGSDSLVGVQVGRMPQAPAAMLLPLLQHVVLSLDNGHAYDLDPLVHRWVPSIEYMAQRMASLEMEAAPVLETDGISAADGGIQT